MSPRPGIDRRVVAAARAHSTAAELRRLGDNLAAGRVERIHLVELAANLYTLADVLTTVLACTVEEESDGDVG